MNQSNARKMNGEIVIDLKELLWRLLEQWKAIIACAVIIMLLFSCAMYLRSSGSASPADDSSASNQNDILAGLSAEDRDTLLGVYNEKIALKKSQDYINDSLFMNLDPYSVNTFTSKWVIDSEEEINKQLITSYIYSLTSSKTAEEINKKWGSKFDTSQIKDLLTACPDVSIAAESKMDNNIITFSVYVPEEMDASVLSGVVSDVMSDLNQELSETIGSHSIRLLGEGSNVISDTLLAENQFNIINRAYTLKLQVNTLTNYLTADQKSQLNSLVKQGGVIKDTAEEDSDATENVNDAEASEAGSKGKSISFFTKKNMLLGFALGLIAYVGLYVLYFIFSGKTVSALMLEETFGLQVLGELHENKKDMLRSDKFIFRKHHKGRMDEDVELERAAESLKSYGDLKGYKNLLLIVKDKSDIRYIDFINSLTKKIGDSYASVNITEVNMKEGTYLKESDLLKNDAVVMLTDLNRTAIKDVKEVCNKTDNCNTPLLGTICLGM